VSAELSCGEEGGVLGVEGMGESLFPRERRSPEEELPE